MSVTSSHERLPNVKRVIRDCGVCRERRHPIITLAPWCFLYHRHHASGSNSCSIALLTTFVLVHAIVVDHLVHPCFSLEEAAPKKTGTGYAVDASLTRCARRLTRQSRSRRNPTVERTSGTIAALRLSSRSHPRIHATNGLPQDSAPTGHRPRRPAAD